MAENAGSRYYEGLRVTADHLQHMQDRLWEAVADIVFIAVPDSGDAFNAAGATGDNPIAQHGGGSFGGAGGVLAHAFFSPVDGSSAAGDLHFDVADD